MKAGGFAFRVDASHQIGRGHVVRCLTLARGLKERGVSSTFISRILDGNLNKHIRSQGFSVIELPPPNNLLKSICETDLTHSHWLEVDWKTDALQTRDALLNLQIDWLVIDHYGLWEKWQTEVRICGAKIMVIDDLADRRHDCDLMLDQNLGSNLDLYKDLIPQNCRKLFGPEYALLRPEFAEYRAMSLARRNKGQIDHILINFGGGDPGNYIARTLKALLSANIPRQVRISIIFGGLGKVKPEHQNLISAFENEIKTYGMVENIAEILTCVDLVIGAAGSSSWERCCLGVPSIIFPISFNQNRIAKSLSTLGAAIMVTEKDLINGELTRLVSSLLRINDLHMISEKASSICNGTGLEKIIIELHG